MIHVIGSYVKIGPCQINSCSTEYQGNEVLSVGRKENKLNMSFPVITSSTDIKLLKQLVLIQAISGSLV